jgi:FtsP/CotA-like multicopper oxidase with cupredoxin domain
MTPAAPTAAADGQASRIRRFELSGSRRINGRTMDPARLDAVLERGSHETWIVRNEGNTPHNFHVHGVQFRVLEYAGDSPPPHLAGRKDTVYVPPGAAVRLAVGFEAHADPSTPYMFHCHLLQHEDRGMMGQLIVVEPGHLTTGSRRHGHGAGGPGDG